VILYISGSIFKTSSTTFIALIPEPTITNFFIIFPFIYLHNLCFKHKNEIRTHDEAYFAQNNLIFKPGFEVTAIDRKAKTVSVTKVGKTDSESLDYDRLVLCTGSTPFILPLPGKELKGVVSFRDIYDVEYMQSEAGKSKKVAVIGTGLLGLEAANGLNELGFKVTVIGNMDSIMNMQLDASSGHLLQKVLEQKNISFKLGAITSKIIGKDKVANRSITVTI
jgi:nitrite reductase (NADH) large subunit